MYNMYNNDDNNNNNQYQKFPEEAFLGDFNKQFLKNKLTFMKKSCTAYSNSDELQRQTSFT